MLRRMYIMLSAKLPETQERVTDSHNQKVAKQDDETNTVIFTITQTIDIFHQINNTISSVYIGNKSSGSRFMIY